MCDTCVSVRLKAGSASVAHEGKRSGIFRHELTNSSELSPYPIDTINISPFCSIRNEEPAATVITRLFHLKVCGGGGQRKEVRGEMGNAGTRK